MRMRRPSSALMLAGVASATWALAGSSAPGLAQVEREVLAANAEMNAAAESLDVERFFEWMLDEPGASVAQNGRLYRDRSEAKAAVAAGYGGVQSLARTFEKTLVTPISEDAAVLVAAGTSVVVLTDGRTFEGPFAVSVVFVRRGATWKVLQGHYSIPAQQ
jgi:SnoaL-like domain